MVTEAAELPKKLALGIQVIKHKIKLKAILVANQTVKKIDRPVLDE